MKYYLCIYDFDHLKMFENKKLQIEFFKNPAVIHFRISNEIKQLIKDNKLDEFV